MRLTKIGILLLILSIAGCARHPNEINKDAKLYYEAGVGYINKGQPRDAIETLKKAESLDSGQPEILHMLGLAYFQSGSLDKALEKMEQAKAKDPNNPELRNNLANVYLGLQKYEETVREATAALTQENYYTPAAAYFVRGVAQMKLGMTDKAMDDFQLAIKIDPFFDRPCIRLGELYISQGRYDEALKLLKQAISVNPNNAEAFLLRGSAFWSRGMISDAEADFNKVLRMVPESSPFARSAQEWLGKIR